jgi:uncharacterized protein YdhG (YjbR/CyaY superfamily)
MARMRKAKTGTRTPAKKSKSGPTNLEEYLAGVPEPARDNFNKLRAAVRSAVPAEATEIISYRMPAFKHKKVLVWFAAFANHCSLFPTAAVMDEFKNELKGFTTSKGTVQFPLDKPIPTSLVKKLVKARAVHSEGKKQN